MTWLKSEEKWASEQEVEALFNKATEAYPKSSPIWVEFIFAAERFNKERSFIAGNILKLI